MECSMTNEYQTEQSEPQNNYKACEAHITVWAWMSTAGVGRLVFIGGTTTTSITKKIYCEVPKNRI